jgi:hypothetical protein
MDIIHTISRVVFNVVPKQPTPPGHVIQLFPVCCDTLETLCRAVLSACPQELGKHLQTVVACLTPFAKEDSTDGKQVTDGETLKHVVTLSAEALSNSAHYLD